MRCFTILMALGFPFLVFASSGSEWGKDIDKAFANAKLKQRPLLIDFYGIWCPPCNDLDDMVFSSPTFKERAKSFELLKVDVDQKESFALKSRYKIGGYPTILFTDPKGEEIYRLVGSRTLKEFIRTMNMAVGAKAKPLQKACKSKAVEDLWRCALVCNERKDRVCAEKAFTQIAESLKAGSPRYLLARTFFVENAPNNDLRRQGYVTLMQDYSSSPLALIWASDYLHGFDTEPAAVAPNWEVVNKVLGQRAAMEASPDKEELGVATTDLLQMRADLLAKANRPDEAKATWKEAADAYAKAAASLPPGTPARGMWIERISCLDLAGESEAALTLAQEYRSKYPGEFTFHYIAASILERRKRFADALPVAQKAYEASYGDNRIRAATLLVNIYATVPNKAEAQKVVDDVTKAMATDATLDVRTPRYLKRLQDSMKQFK